MATRTLLLFFILIFVAPSSFAQQRVIDQLEPLRDTLPPSIEKVDVLIAMARAYGYCGYSEKKYKVLEEANDISRQIGYKEGIGLCLIFQSIQEFNEGDIDRSLESIEKATAIAEEIGSKDFKLFCDYNLAEFYVYGKSNFKKGIAISKKALLEAGTNASKKNIGNTQKILAISYTGIGDTTMALRTFQTALEIFESYEDSPDIDPGLGTESAQTLDHGAMNAGQIHEYTGQLYTNQGRLDLALLHSLSALHTYEEWEAPFFEGGVSLGIADILQLQGRLDEALKYLRKAKDDFILINNTYFEAQANSKIGSIHAQLGDLVEAQKITKEALGAFIQEKDSLDMMDTYKNLGKIELSLNNLDNAESHFTSAFEIAEILKDSLGMGKNAGMLGNIAAQNGDFESGLSYQKRALSIKEAFGRIVEMPNTLLDISSLFENWDKPDSAIYYAQMALDYSAQTKTTTNLKNSHLKLSELYKSDNDFEKSLIHHHAFHGYFQKLYTENAQQLLKEEQVRQNVELFQKEKAAAEANAALLSQRNRLFVALGTTFLFLFLASGYLGLRLRSSKKEIESQNQKLTDLNQTKDKFFGIIAHDIRSPMVALQSVGKQMEFYLKKGRFDKLESLAKMVEQTTHQLDALLDNLLNWALLQRGVMPFNPSIISLNNVVSDVSNLFNGAIEAKHIHFKKEIPDGIKVVADESALHTTLRNLMSNAIKFTPEGGIVSINSEIENRSVLIKIKDTGTGIEKEILEKLFSLERKSTKGTAGEKGTGLGLILCKELIEMNKGGLAVFSEVGNGSSFEFSIPKK